MHGISFAVWHDFAQNFIAFIIQTNQNRAIFQKRVRDPCLARPPTFAFSGTVPKLAHQKVRFLRISIIESKTMDEQNLFEKIMLRIRAEQKRMVLKRKTAGFSFALAVSFLGLIPAIKMAYSGFVGSGFVQLFSLVFSDTSIVMAYWQNVVLSLLESLPITGLMAIGVSLFVILGSLKFLSKNIKGFYNKQQLVNI